MTAVTGDTREATYLFQRMSVALQRSPSTALSPPSKRRCGLTCLLFNILYPRQFSTEGQKIIITTTIFIVLSSQQSHCESSLGSRDEYRNGARWPPTFGPSHPNRLEPQARLYRQPVNRIHHRHHQFFSHVVIMLCSPAIRLCQHCSSILLTAMALANM